MATIFCALCAWIMTILLLCSIWLTVKKGIEHLHKLHQIPCHNCEYFTNDYRLKCTVHPCKACCENAIGCVDFEPKTAACNATQKGHIWKLGKSNLQYD